MGIFDTVISKANVIGHKALVKLESTLNGVPGGIHATPLARERTLPPPSTCKVKIQFRFMNLRYMLTYGRAIPKFGLSMLRNIRKSYLSIKQNPVHPKEEAEAGFLTEFEDYARSLGCFGIGYTELEPELIFKDRTALYSHVIVLTMEMNKEDINLAPHPRTMRMVGETYSRLGVAANKLARFLRQRGYAVQAGHPLCGIALYVPLAMKAGLGWGGRHGLLITPEFGGRQRIAVLYTSIKNLPVWTENPHAWVGKYCATCGKCIRSCEARAIYEKPILHEGGTQTHIDYEKCLDYFLGAYGCTVCVKVCPFSAGKYEVLKKQFTS